MPIKPMIDESWPVEYEHGDVRQIRLYDGVIYHENTLGYWYRWENTWVHAPELRDA